MKYQSIQLENYNEQRLRWPKSGRHILAQYDHDSIIVYQAYRPEIGLFAVENQYFGGEFRLSRMSWIKPNFLWMMYRSNWGQAVGQEVVLAIRLKKTFFEKILEMAVPSTFNSSLYSTNEEWKKTVQNSDVRLQWDPDHNPSGNKCERRAIQLGLRGEILAEYSKEMIIEIINISELLTQQRKNVPDAYEKLLIPKEDTYSPGNGNFKNINLDTVI